MNSTNRRLLWAGMGACALAATTLFASRPAIAMSEQEKTEPVRPVGPPIITEDAQKGPVKLEKNGVGEIKDRAPVDGEEVAVMKTSYGRIVLMFFPDKAPNHVKRFKEASEKKVYDGIRFHRVIPNFMIQGGDPGSKDGDRSTHGTGRWGDPLKAEFNDVKHVAGILSAARTSDPDSATSQFFIMHGASPHLDGQYTAYGKVIEGINVVGTIVNLPRDSRDNPLEANPATIYSVRIVKWPITE